MSNQKTDRDLKQQMKTGQRKADGKSARAAQQEADGKNAGTAQQETEQMISRAEQLPEGRVDVDADGNVVLCAASAYEEKYYLNPLFDKLPEEIKKELKIISVLFVEEIGGCFLMEFDEDHELQFRTESLGSDYSYDEIGAALMCREIRSNRQEMLTSLELFYKVFVLGQTMEEACGSLPEEE